MWGKETSLQWNPVFSSADIKTGTFTVSNTGPGDTVSVEIVVRRVKDWSDCHSYCRGRGSSY